MPSKPAIRPEEWDRRLQDADVSKDDLNHLILDYLVIEGHKTAAEHFISEARLSTPVDLDSIESRVSIREALHRGDVESAIGLVNDLDPEILDTNPSLYFHLQQQRLIEFIRLGRIDDALQFAQDELAPRGEESPQFLSELENTMALLAFEASSSMPGGMADLLSPAQRIKTAGEVNAAILGHFNQGREAKLIALLKLLCWGEAVLEEHADFPRVELHDTMGRAGALDVIMGD